MLKIGAFDDNIDSLRFSFLGEGFCAKKKGTELNDEILFTFFLVN